MNNSRFAYGRQPNREEVHFYANGGDASFWLVTTNSRLLLVKATLQGPTLDVHFEVTAPEGAVPFEGTHLLMARDWAPISGRGPLERRNIHHNELTVQGVQQPAYTVVIGACIHAWTYVRVGDTLHIVQTSWFEENKDDALARLAVYVSVFLNNIKPGV